MANEPSYYDLLGLPKDAILEEIRRAYFEAARKIHPDVSPDPNASEKFIQIQKAYEILIDAQAREAYDQKLENENRDPVTNQVIYSRTKLSSISEPQLLYTLLQFSPAKYLASLPVPALNICIIIDRSTSMQGVRMDTVKTAAIELVRQLKPDDILSMVIFSDRAEVLLQANKKTDITQIENQIHMIRPGGGTEIYQGLEAGFNEVSKYSNRVLINHILLITDGRTYGDEEACLRLADKAAQQGIRITGLGIGTEWNDRFLDDLTTRTGGTSYYISKANDIRSFLKDKFNSLSKIFAERVTLSLNLTEGIKLSSVFRLQPEPTILPAEFPVRLGSIHKESKLSILLEFMVPSVPENLVRFPIATGQLSLVLPSDPQKARVVPLSLSRLTTPDTSTELPPREIFQALSQITLYRMQERARQEISEGKIQDASLRLQRLATQLLSLGEVELAQTAIIEAERIQQTHMLSAEGEKQIKYGTRSFLLPANVEEQGIT
jgi:Ca-activated chloride channel homolog